MTWTDFQRAARRRSAWFAVAAMIVGCSGGTGASAGVAATPAAAPGPKAAATAPLRVGYFPNVTHVQALVARSFTREGKGWFESRLGPGTRIEWFVYNAGPSAMEAIFAKSLDLTYVGPSPAINAYSRARGTEIRVVAGAAEGGSALVVQPKGVWRGPGDFRGRRIATPQLGNTQDVAARAWLAAGGLRITMLGGDAEVVPTANPDQLALFKTGGIAGVWTVEPWVSRLELESGGKVLVDDRKAVTTVLVSSVAALATRRDLVRRFVAAHRELTTWIQQNPAEAQRRVRSELEAQTRAAIGPTIIGRAWPRIHLTTDIALAPLQKFQADAQKAGLLRAPYDLGKLIVVP